MDTSASVWSMMIAPPEGSVTSRRYAVSIWCSIWKREKRHVVLVEFDLVHVGRHHVDMNDCACSKISGVSMRISPMSNRSRIAHHQARFEINQLWRLDVLGRAFDGFPKLDQVIHVPLSSSTVRRCRPCGDDAHAVRASSWIDHVAQLVAVFALPRGARHRRLWVVGHQHQIAPANETARW